MGAAGRRASRSSTPASCRRSSSACASMPGCSSASLCASLLHVLMARTVLGFEIRAVGDNLRRRALSPASASRDMIKVGLLSGALAGLAGASEVAGLKGYLTADLSRGFGYAGIVVAMLAGLQPLLRRPCRDLRRGRLRRRRHHEPDARRVELHRRSHRRAGAALRPRRAASSSASAIRWQLDHGEVVLDILISANFWAAALRIATPLMFGVLGALVCERAGVLNLGIEGIFTAGAMAGWMAVYLGAGLWTGVARRGADGRRLRAPPRAPDGAARACRSTSPASASRCSRRARPISSIAWRCRTSRRRRASRRSSRSTCRGLSDLPFIGPALFQQTPLTYPRARRSSRSSPSCSTGRRSASRSAPSARTRRRSRRRASTFTLSASAPSSPAPP